MSMRPFLFGLSLLVLLPGCTDLGSVNFRYDVTVDTPRGKRTGWSVLGMRGYEIPGSQHIGGGQKLELSGDVPFVDLPNGVTLFALLADSQGSQGPLAAMLWSKRRPGVRGDYRDALAELKANPVCKEVEKKYLPRFVYFLNFNDQNTAKEVRSDQLESEFGAGYRISNVKVCVTSEKPTFNVDARLPWIGKQLPPGVRTRILPNIRFQEPSG